MGVLSLLLQYFIAKELLISHIPVVKESKLPAVRFKIDDAARVKAYACGKHFPRQTKLPDTAGLKKNMSGFGLLDVFDDISAPKQDSSVL